MTGEEMYIKIIESGIRNIRLNWKSPKEINLTTSFKRLKDINEGMYLDLLNKYRNIIDDYNKKNPKDLVNCKELFIFDS